MPRGQNYKPDPALEAKQRARAQELLAEGHKPARVQALLEQQALGYVPESAIKRWAAESVESTATTSTTTETEETMPKKKDIRQTAIDRVAGGESQAAVARELGIPRTTLSTWLHRPGSEPAPVDGEAVEQVQDSATPVEQEERRTRTAHGPDTREQAVSLMKEGKSAKDVATEMNISLRTVSDWRTKAARSGEVFPPPVVAESTTTEDPVAQASVVDPRQQVLPAVPVPMPPVVISVAPAATAVSAPAALHPTAPADTGTPERSHVQTPEHSHVQAFGHANVQPSRRVVLNRKDGRTLNRTTIYLPPDLARWLAIRSAETGRDQSEIVTEALLMLARPAGDGGAAVGV